MIVTIIPKTTTIIIITTLLIWRQVLEGREGAAARKWVLQGEESYNLTAVRGICSSYNRHQDDDAAGGYDQDDDAGGKVKIEKKSDAMDK